MERLLEQTQQLGAAQEPHQLRAASPRVRRSANGKKKQEESFPSSNFVLEEASNDPASWKSGQRHAIVSQANAEDDDDDDSANAKTPPSRRGANRTVERRRRSVVAFAVGSDSSPDAQHQSGCECRRNRRENSGRNKEDRKGRGNQERRRGSLASVRVGNRFIGPFFQHRDREWFGCVLVFPIALSFAAPYRQQTFVRLCCVAVSITVFLYCL